MERSFVVAAVGMLANLRVEKLSEKKANRLFDQLSGESGAWLYVALIEDGDNLVDSWHAKGAV